MKEANAQTNNTVISNSVPFVSNISANYSSSICNPFYTNTTVASDPGKLFTDMLTMSTTSNNVNKMDVEDTFIISQALSGVTSHQGITIYIEQKEI